MAKQFYKNSEIKYYRVNDSIPGLIRLRALLVHGGHTICVDVIYPHVLGCEGLLASNSLDVATVEVMNQAFALGI